MNSPEDNLRSAAKAADYIIGGTIILCSATLLYCVYYYSWTQQRSFTSPLGPLVYYVLPAMLAGLLCVSLRLRRSYRINLALLLISIGISLYTAEQVLALYGRKGGEVQIARGFGVNFDDRSTVDVILDLKKRHIHAVPTVFPHALLNWHGDGTLRSKLTINGIETLPLGGIANRMTVDCNDGGEFVIYESDEHGFHNPKGIWDADPIDIAAIGDSFVNGSCAPSEKNFVALIRKRYPLTLNLGRLGNGPLLELATLEEYLPSLKPTIVLWFYFEGNDSIDLSRERESPLLISYLSDNSTQGLLHRQGEIDQALIASIEPQINAEKSKQRLEKITARLKLWHLRSRLGLNTGASKDERELEPALDLDLFGRILVHARTLVDTWHGRLAFVYLPEVARYASLENANKDRDQVLALVSTLGIPIIDIHPRFQAHSDPLALFHFRRKIHYNEEGHRLVAEEVLRSH